MLHKTDLKVARVLSYSIQTKKCTSILKYKDRSTFFVIGDGDWEIKCNRPVVNLTAALLASQDLYVIRCILIIDLGKDQVMLT